MLLHASAGGYGADRQLYAIATGLDRQRYRPLVVLGEEGPLAEQLDDAGVEVARVPLATLRRHLVRGRGIAGTLWLRRRNRAILGDLACTRRAAVVHSNSSIVLSGQAIADAAGIPHLLHLREIYAGAGGRAADALWPLLRRRLLRADAVACVSKAVAEQLGGSPRAFLVYDGLPRNVVLPPRDAARRELRIDPSRFVVAMIGRISDWKGHDLFLHALADGPLSEIDAVGLVAGDAAPDQRHFEDEVGSLADQLGLNGRVRLLGFRDDIGPLLAAADAVVVPSRHADSLPNSALEAASARLPIVATSVGGLPEIVRDGLTGRLVAAGDALALGSALRELAEDPARARLLGAAAADDVAARFGRGAMVEQLQECYDRLLAACRRSAWLVATKEHPVSQPAAPQLRLARMEEWLRELGYEPRVVSSAPLARLPRLALAALLRPPALVLTNTARAAPLLRLLRMFRRARVFLVSDVIGLHSLEIEQASRRWARPALRRIWLRLERMMVRSSHVVLAVNDRHAQIVRRRLGHNRVHTVRDAAEAELAEVVAADRGAFGVPAGAVAVGFVGSMVNDRLRPIFDAWRILGDSPEPKLCLVLVGDGPDLERYRSEAEDEGWLGRSVFFLGALPRPQALSVLAACDIGYSDCWSEAGFPAKLFEYMALGKPVLTQARRQTNELLDEGRNAMFFRSSEELADRIRDLAVDAPMRAHLAANARTTLLGGHTVEQRRLEFHSLLSGDPPPPPKPVSRSRGRPQLVSVVLPIRNGAGYVEEQLAALARQEYEGAWELVVADNGCTDSSVAIVESWRHRLPALRVVDAGDRRGLNHARNCGAEAARGDFLAFCDADDVVCPGWLAALADAGADADLVGGVTDLTVLNPPEVSEWLRGTTLDGLHGGYDFLPYVSGGNCGVWSDVAREIGWDESFRFGGSDVEFAWRLQLRSYRVAVVPGAVLHRRVDTSLRSLVRRNFAYGRSEPQLYRVFRERGMRRHSLRYSARQWTRLARSLPDLVRSPGGRGRWLRLAALRCGRIAGSLRWRVLYL